MRAVLKKGFFIAILTIALSFVGTAQNAAADGVLTRLGRSLPAPKVKVTRHSERVDRSAVGTDEQACQAACQSQIDAAAADLQANLPANCFMSPASECPDDGAGDGGGETLIVSCDCCSVLNYYCVEIDW